LETTTRGMKTDAMHHTSIRQPHIMHHLAHVFEHLIRHGKERLLELLIISYHQPVYVLLVESQSRYLLLTNIFFHSSLVLENFNYAFSYFPTNRTGKPGSRLNPDILGPKYTDDIAQDGCGSEVGDIASCLDSIANITAASIRTHR